VRAELASPRSLQGAGTLRLKHVSLPVRTVIIETNKSTERVFPAVPDVENPEFFRRMDLLVKYNEQVVNIGKMNLPEPVKVLLRLPLIERMVAEVFQVRPASARLARWAGPPGRSAACRCRSALARTLHLTRVLLTAGVHHDPQGNRFLRHVREQDRAGLLNWQQPCRTSRLAAPLKLQRLERCAARGLFAAAA
jgi:hypothetical protein